MSEVLYTFIPSPHDNFSPLTGSANIVWLYEISRRYVAEGHRARFVMGRNKLFDYPLGECVRVDFPPFLTREEKWRDLAMGWLGLPRRHRAAMYNNAAAVIEPEYNGTIFLFNDAAALTPFRARCPQATLVLYCGNEIWKTFSNGEIRRMLSLADHIVCVSRFMAQDLKRRLRGACLLNGKYAKMDNKISVIPNGVNLEMFHPRETAISVENSDATVPVVLFVGRVQPVKGPHLLIEAARLLQEKGCKIRVRIVGSQAFTAHEPLSAYEQSLRRLAEPLGDYVEFQPFVTRHEIAEEYRKADIFCMPSVWNEPFGLTLLEGMATGLPTVATRRGALPDTGGEALKYFDPKNVHELAEVLALWAEDENVRREWGVRARKRAEEYSWDRHYCELNQMLVQAK